jgi:hypothetical protein
MNLFAACIRAQPARRRRSILPVKQECSDIRIGHVAQRDKLAPIHWFFGKDYVSRGGIAPDIYLSPVEPISCRQPDGLTAAVVKEFRFIHVFSPIGLYRREILTRTR